MAASHERVEHEPVERGARPLGGGDVLGVAGGGLDASDGEDRADAAGHVRVPELPDRQAVGEQDVVHGVEAARALAAQWWEESGDVSGQRGVGGFVHGVPLVDAVAEAFGHDAREPDELIDGFAAHPAAAAVLEPLRGVPVVEAGGRTHAAGEQPVDEPVVVVEARLVDGALRVGDDARPGDRETVRLCAELAEQVEVLVEPVVFVGGCAEVGAVGHVEQAGLEGRVPHGWRLAVRVPCAFDLVGGVAGSPEEILGQ